MQVVATSKSVRQSTRKVGLVASLVRGRTVSDAITILEHTPKRAAEPIRKTIESAKANAENNHDMDASTLIIANLEIGPADTLKRYRPAAHGRAQPFKRRSTNIRVVLEGEQIVKKKTTVKKADTKKDGTKKTTPQDTSSKTDKSTDDATKGTVKNTRGFMNRKNRQSNVPVTKKRTGVRGNK